MNASEFNRFFAKVLVGDKCWEWQNGTFWNGYGMFKIGGKVRKAHIVSFEHFYGRIPRGLVVMHTCDNPKCVNPYHLELGTLKDNYDDMVAKNRAGWQKMRRVFKTLDSFEKHMKSLEKSS